MKMNNNIEHVKIAVPDSHLNTHTFLCQMHCISIYFYGIKINKFYQLDGDLKRIYMSPTQFIESYDPCDLEKLDQCYQNQIIH